MQVTVGVVELFAISSCDSPRLTLSALHSSKCYEISMFSNGPQTHILVYVLAVRLISLIILATRTCTMKTINL